MRRVGRVKDTISNIQKQQFLVLDILQQSTQSFLHHHDIFNDFLGQLQQHWLWTVPQVMGHLLVAHRIVFLAVGVRDIAEEGPKGAFSELLAVVEVAENVNDAGHAEKVVELEHFVCFEVLLEGAVNQLSGSAVRPKKISVKLRLCDLLIESCTEMLVLFADLRILAPAFLVQLSVSRLRTTNPTCHSAPCLSRFRSQEVSSPVESRVLFGHFCDGEVLEQLFVEDDVIFDEIEGEHETLHPAHLLLNQFNLIYQLRQKVYLLQLQLHQLFLLPKSLLLFLDANRGRNAETLTSQFARFLLQPILNLAVLLNAALEFCLVQDLRLRAGFWEVRRKHWMLPNLRKSYALFLLNSEHFAEKVLHLFSAVLQDFFLRVCHCLAVAEIFGLPSKLLALVFESPVGIDFLMRRSVQKGQVRLSMQNRSTPKAHISTSQPQQSLSSYAPSMPCLQISGAMNCSVPKTVPSTLVAFLVKPKSAILNILRPFSSFTSTFCGFMSRCRQPRRCRLSRPKITWLRYSVARGRAKTLLGCLACRFMRSPPSQYSSTMQKYSSSCRNSLSSTMYSKLITFMHSTSPSKQSKRCQFSPIIFFLSITFNAHRGPPAPSSTRKTSPKAPLPNFRLLMYFPRKTLSTENRF